MYYIFVCMKIPGKWIIKCKKELSLCHRGCRYYKWGHKDLTLTSLIFSKEISQREQCMTQLNVDWIGPRTSIMCMSPFSLFTFS